MISASTLTAGCGRTHRASAGVLLALLAMFCLMLASGWHAAHVNSHDAHADVHLAAAPHHTAAPDAGDHDSDAAPDATLHSVAHSVQQGLDVPAASPFFGGLLALALVWEVARQALRPSHAPASLLRPPRS